MDLIQDIRHRCTRLRTDGIKAISSVFFREQTSVSGQPPITGAKPLDRKKD